MTITGPVSVAARMSNTVMTYGLVSAAAVRASRSVRSCSSLAWRGGMPRGTSIFFSATCRRSNWSVAVHTLPCAPRPIIESSR